MAPRSRRIAAFLGLAAALLALAYLRLRPPAAPAPTTPTATAAARAPRRPRAPDLRREPRAAISGQVTDPARAPIAQASVCATFESTRLSSAETSDPICTATDASGRYRFADLVPARYQIAASAPRHRPARYVTPPPSSRPFFDLEPGRTETVDVVLEPGGVEVHGHVKDLSGGVIKGARVVLREMRVRPGAGFALARTDAEGAFSAWVPEGPVFARADADGYTDAVKSGSAPGVDIELLLTPESVLVGRVVEEGSDDPVPGAKIALDEARLRSAPSAIADEDGRFRIRRLGAGRYKPVATAPGRYGQATESALLALGETSKEIRVEVHPAFDVDGRVVVAGKGEPCPDGTVDLVDRARKRQRRSALDKDGAARFEGVLPGSYDVTVACEGRIAEPRYPPVVVAAADVTGVAWSVREGLELRGRLVDRDDKPVEGHVRGSSKNADPRAPRVTASASVGPDGRFTLKGLLPGTCLLTTTPRDRPSPDPMEVEIREGRQDEVKIVVEGGGAVEGTVVDEEGHAVAGAVVSVTGPKVRLGRWDQAESLPDGSFKLEGLTPGPYRVHAGHDAGDLPDPGKGADDPRSVPATVKVGAAARVKLVVERRKGEIHGQVVDEQGGPVTDAFLDAQRESDSPSAAPGSAKRSVRWSAWARPPALTDLEGKFTLGGLGSGVYTVRASRKGAGEAFAEHVQLGQTVRIDFAAAGSIAGSVKVGSGGSPEQFTLRVADPHSGFSRSEGFFRTAGAWAMNDLPAGHFEVSVDAPEGTAVQEVTLSGGERKAGVTLALAGRTTLKGQVVSLDGARPVPGMRVTVLAQKGAGSTMRGEDPGKNNVTDQEGRFTLEGAPAGPILISLVPIDQATSDFGATQVPVAGGDGAITDVGQLAVARRQVRALDPGGDLGFDVQERTPGTDPGKVTIKVAAVRPGGPAAAAGLAAGDVIVSVDGHDVTGVRSYLYGALTRVGEGTTVALGLQRGDRVSVTAVKP